MTRYEKDVIAWADEQAALLRAGSFAQLDIERIILLVERAGTAEIGQFYHAMSLVLRHLLTWEHTAEGRTKKLRTLIIVRRREAIKLLRRTPSLSIWLAKATFWQDAWEGAVAERRASGKVTEPYPATCPWTPSKVLDEGFFPE
ncbi:DUF29 domain-containing protein [Paraburkholderia sp. GAS42]|uniref:DUF29 domain-containing protein n=1 Tax=Paraburkholderia sp. GAS42 TaxID=3035135 RepID=UPI003D2555ED